MVGECGNELGTARRTYHVLVKDVRASGSNMRQGQAAVRQNTIIDSGVAHASGILNVERHELYAQHRCLQFVESRIDARNITDVPGAPAVLTQQAHAFEHRIVGGTDGAAVTERRKILGGVEAEGGGVAPGAGHSFTDAHTVRLRAILDKERS